MLESEIKLLGRIEPFVIWPSA